MEPNTIDSLLGLSLDPVLRGKMLKKKREFLHLSQADVAKEIASRLGKETFDYKRISAWERGTTKTIPENIKRYWYDILGLTEYEDLINLKEKAENDLDSIYIRLASEFKSYVSKQVGNDPDLLEQKEFSNRVAWTLEGLLTRFLQNKNLY